MHLERIDLAHRPRVASLMATAKSDVQRSRIAQETADEMAEVLGLDDPLLDALIDDVRFG